MIALLIIAALVTLVSVIGALLLFGNLEDQPYDEPSDLSHSCATTDAWPSRDPGSESEHS